MADRPASSSRVALLSLCLLVPLPTLGVLFGMVWFPGQWLGNTVFALSKLCVLGLPLLWWVWVERGRLSWSPCPREGVVVGFAVGLLTATVIVGSYAVVGRRLLNPDIVQGAVSRVRLSNPVVYIAGAAYWSFVNSLLEEYVWRWFVLRQCSRLMSRRTAVLASAFAFTFHHFAAMPTFLGIPMSLVGGTGIFLGACVWGWCYTRYQSIWPGYISHVFADLAILGIGYLIMFG